LKDLQTWFPSADDYFDTSEMWLSSPITHLELTITDPETGESIPYPNEEAQNES
jgi:hypothetical protein